MVVKARGVGSMAGVGSSAHRVAGVVAQNSGAGLEFRLIIFEFGCRNYLPTQLCDGFEISFYSWVSLLNRIFVLISCLVHFLTQTA